MKYKIIIIGLALLALLFPDLSVTAPYHNEEALQKTARLKASDVSTAPIPNA